MRNSGLTATVAAAAILMAGQSASAEHFTVGNGFSPTHFFGKDLTEPWMTCVEEGTGKGITFDYYPSGQIAAATATLDALNSGLLDISAVSIGYVTNKLPLSGISMLPDMGQTSKQMVAAYRTALKEIPELAEELRANGIQPLVINLFPPYQILARGEPIDTADKFEGKLIRSAGAANTLTLRELGASPVEMPAADIYIALERGTVDAALLGLSSIKNYSLHELVKSISANGQFGSFTTLLGMDRKKYEALSEEFRAVVDQCALKIEAAVGDLMDGEHQALLEEFAGMGITIYEYSDEELAKLSERMRGVEEDFVTRLEARGLPAGRVMEGYKKIVAETPTFAGE